MSGFSFRLLSKSVAALVGVALLFQFQNCGSPNSGSTLMLGSGNNGQGTSGSPTPPPPASDASSIEEFYVLAGGSVVVSTTNPSLNGPLENNGMVYYSKTKFMNTGTNTWTTTGYRVQVLDGASQWFINGRLQLQCLDVNSGVPVAVPPGGSCHAYTATPNPGSLKPTFAGIAPGSCLAGAYVSKIIRLQMINTSTGTLFGPIISKEIFICQN